MKFGQRVLLIKDGVPYEYRLTFKGWIVALILRLQDILHITIIQDETD